MNPILTISMWRRSRLREIDRISFVPPGAYARGGLRELRHRRPTCSPQGQRSAHAGSGLRCVCWRPGAGRLRRWFDKPVCLMREGVQRQFSCPALMIIDGGHDPDVLLTVFLMADAVAAAKANQKTSEGYYNVERMLKRVLAGKGKVLLCGTCLDARHHRE